MKGFERGHVVGEKRQPHVFGNSVKRVEEGRRVDL